MVTQVLLTGRMPVHVHQWFAVCKNPRTCTKSHTLSIWGGGSVSFQISNSSSFVFWSPRSAISILSHCSRTAAEKLYYIHNIFCLQQWSKKQNSPARAKILCDFCFSSQRHGFRLREERAQIVLHKLTFLQRCRLVLNVALFFGKHNFQNLILCVFTTPRESLAEC